MQNYLCAIGGINADIKGIADGNSTQSDSHEGKVLINSGGVARNIAENLSRLNVPVYLLGCVGDDEHGNFILEQCEQTNINVDRLIKSKSVSTAKYLSVSKNDGSLVYAVNDMKESLQQITPGYIIKNTSLLSEARLIVADTNLSEETLNEIISIANSHNVPLLIDTVSVKKTEVINNLNGTIDYLSPNKIEFEKLFEDSNNIFEKNTSEKFKYVILKKGADGVTLYDFTNENTADFNALELKAIEPNGAGDSFNAGFIFGLLNNYPIEESVKLGMCASYFTLQSVNSVSEKLTSDNLIEFYNLNYTKF